MNALWVILGLIGAAAILLILNHDSGSVLGIANDDFASLVWYGIWGTVVAAAVFPRRGQWREAARNAVLWLTIFLVLMAGYLYRYELQDVASRLTAGLVPGSPISTGALDGRERVTLLRDRGGHFTARGEVDGATVLFVVDTGATVVVLTREDAIRAGIAVDALSYDAPVSTANGTTTAARLRLDRLAVGDIERENVQAMVAREGALEQSLLGMSFLSRLSSFEFRGDRLIFTD